MITQEPTSTLGSHTGSGPQTNADFAGRARDGIHQVASKAHQAIEKLEQTLNAKGLGNVGSGASSGSSSLAAMRDKASESLEQGRQYSEQLRERVYAQPLQSAGAAFAAGVVLSNLFAPRHKTRDAKVPDYSADMKAHARATEARTQRWAQAAGDKLHQLAGSGQDAVKRLGATGMSGLAGAKALSADMLYRTRKALPPASEARARTQAMMARSQAYGSMARSQIQEHPVAGLAVAIGLGAAAMQMLLGQRRTSEPMYGSRRATYAVGKDGEVLGPEWGEPRSSMLAARPMMSAGVALGVGVLLGALLTRR